jgi:hypothetical protein
MSNVELIELFSGAVHTEDDNSYVDRTEDAEFICFLKESILSLRIIINDGDNAKTAGSKIDE